MTTRETSSKPQQDRLNPVVFFTSAGLILAFSLIRETLARGERTQQLEIHESARLQLLEGRASIYGLRLDIRQRGE